MDVIKMRKLVLLLVLPLLAAMTLSRNGVYQNGLSFWEDVIRKSPNKGRPHYNLGMEWRALGRLDLAQVEWERAVAFDHGLSEAYNQLGNIRLLIGAYQEAERYYTLAVQTNPGNSEAQYNLATVLEALHKPDEALEHYRIFLTQAPPEYRDRIPQVVQKINTLEPEHRQ